MEASRAGKAIFCEKPISLNLEIIDEVCQVRKFKDVNDAPVPLCLGLL